MITLNIVDRQGNTTAISANTDTSLMEAIRDNGFDQLLALCGGCCSCATCHVYVEGPLGQSGISGDEDDLLDSSAHRSANSRLSCQVRLSAEHDGVFVRIAPED
ncbi:MULTISPECIES: 2Fe-2S iron-sulfur cluster-binding protein [Novosphingobium]|uniref:2Fe-2S iron-sulfur cluster-binding protein n=1 Tax=Novosphingobium TaxID=165696 RepID=UPI0007884490|nr:MULTISPECIES: 2Fe-2S iron-sulfur cluster-binding protein [Novosphingobium]PTR10429.1 2Fe-2S ferredoxin [Novosphingobium sp. GV055]PUB03100.1 2Fe-2S ferredoxin [Novosphingobium sp. GV061]PUB19761.1 2Fe-2S ferredoxin [Novosphingobium sp. GV079]PUB41400.1 2Fe-2S ferredoxin [Novosphingobium sp. GV027]WQD94174.1 2Fe-2S iron-sulfur cluster-binding protein [Novosphingobium capsulatum]